MRKEHPVLDSAGRCSLHFAGCYRPLEPAGPGAPDSASCRCRSLCSISSRSCCEHMSHRDALSAHQSWHMRAQVHTFIALKRRSASSFSQMPTSLCSRKNFSGLPPSLKNLSSVSTHQSSSQLIADLAHPIRPRGISTLAIGCCLSFSNAWSCSTTALLEECEGMRRVH